MKHMMGTLKTGFAKEWSIFFITYFFSFGLMLFNKGLFWDDWTIYGNTRQNLIQIFSMTGLSGVGYAHSFLLSTTFPVFMYRVIIFIAFFLSGLCLNGVLKKVRQIDSVSRIYLVLLFLLFPLNNLRFEIIMLFSSLCYLSFYAGWWATQKYLGNGIILWRLFSLCLFLIAMVTYSIVMFYAIILIYIIYLETEGRGLARTQCAKILIKKYPDYVLIPLIAIFCRFTIFTPYGMYVKYNEIQFSTLIHALLFTPAALWMSFTETLSRTLSLSGTVLVSTVIVLSLIKAVKNPFPPLLDRAGFETKGILLGVVVLFLGVFPYLAVGKAPSFEDASTRHQLLMPLGCAFIFFYGIIYLFRQLNLRNELMHFFLCLVLASFTVKNIHDYLSFQRDWYKQVSLIRQFQKSDVIKENSSFLVDDMTIDLNANKRFYRSYDFSGLFRFAYNDGKSRYAVYNKEYLKNPGNVEHDYFLMQFYVLPKPKYLIKISHSDDYPLGERQTLKLLALEYLAPMSYEAYIDNAIRVTYKKL